MGGLVERFWDVLGLTNRFILEEHYWNNSCVRPKSTDLGGRNLRSRTVYT
jgi:hypothetical protein